MRGLTPEEYEYLSGRRYREWKPGESGREDSLVVCERLHKQGRLVRTDYPDGSFGYSKSELGRLALRVAAPFRSLV